MQDTDDLVAHMLLEGYLEKSYGSNPYKVQVYIQPSALAKRLDEGRKIVVNFLLPERASRDRRTKEGGKKRKAVSRPRTSNGSAAAHVSEDEDPDVAYLSGEDGQEGEDGRENAPGPSSKRRRSGHQPPPGPNRLSDVEMSDDADDDSESEDAAEWKGNLRGAPAVTHRTLRQSPRKASLPSGSRLNMLCDDEVIEISE